MYTFPSDWKAQPPKHVIEVVEKYAKQYDVDPKLILAQIYLESRYDPFARSTAGAVGIMQLMPRTFYAAARALDFQVPNIFSIEQNIAAGVYELSKWIKHFSGLGYPEEEAQKLGLAAYNYGIGNLRRILSRQKRDKRNYAGIEHKLPQETREYVSRISDIKEKIREIPDTLSSSPESLTKSFAQPVSTRVKLNPFWIINNIVKKKP
ncbi:MAG: transglycosylase SLT domain-containing protein [Fervidobacterium sp.]